MSTFEYRFDQNGRPVKIRNDRYQLVESLRANMALSKTPKSLYGDIVSRIIPTVSDNTCRAVINLLMDTMNAKQLKETNKIISRVNAEYKNKQKKEESNVVHVKRVETNNNYFRFISNSSISNIVSYLPVYIEYRDVECFKLTSRRMSIICLKFMEKCPFITVNMMRLMDPTPKPLQMFSAHHLKSSNSYDGCTKASSLYARWAKQNNIANLFVYPVTLSTNPFISGFDETSYNCFRSTALRAESCLSDTVDFPQFMLFDMNHIMCLGIGSGYISEYIMSNYSIVLLLYCNELNLMQPVQYLLVGETVTYETVEWYLLHGFEARNEEQEKFQESFEKEIAQKQNELKQNEFDSLIKFYENREADSNWSRVFDKAVFCGDIPVFQTIIFSLTEIRQFEKDQQCVPSGQNQNNPIVIE